jgi:DNA-binding response OmpR family regulator
MRVLICDDDSMSLRILEFQFKKDGFEILKATSGKEGRKMLLENKDIDLLVTDVHMPSVNGMELITYVRETLNSNIPIIIVSRANVKENIQLAYDLGANEYLTKPFDMNDISERVKKLLENEKND